MIGIPVLYFSPRLNTVVNLRIETRFAKYQASRWWACVDIGHSTPGPVTGSSNILNAAQVLHVSIHQPISGFLEV
ncbi:hypothetical protein N7509_011745 [Penicillium cosmopolitanum]|uniref:Uncharacterized protein n=1 Tax=Penicillium cosmopolitanum TaxID=1131564 RepID=A0A9W9VGL6_9EURO|nr:uncharacterized protein N7509_011745 [Penicillium cosmopolitanum]KAJ5378626.1 hypothetical protein N7509_011745 [Penicillium cosmopolitanum]